MIKVGQLVDLAWCTLRKSHDNTESIPGTWIQLVKAIMLKSTKSMANIYLNDSVYWFKIQIERKFLISLSTLISYGYFVHYNSVGGYGALFTYSVSDIAVSILLCKMDTAIWIVFERPLD